MGQKPTADSQDFESRFRSVHRTIRKVADETERDPQSITLIAVTKGLPVQVIQQALNHGIDHIGESRVRQAVSRKDEVGSVSEEADWHMIGHVQSNKVKDLLGEFDLIHSVDRPSLVDELQKRLSRRDLTQSVLLQVNVSREDSKYGATPEETPRVFEMILEASRLSIRGLMTMAPYTDDESVLRSTFADCRSLREKLQESYGVDLPELSMGMTNDFPQAIKEGSTMLRIGRGLFGERPD